MNGISKAKGGKTPSDKYRTLIGGVTSWNDRGWREYTCIYGKLRIVYNPNGLRQGWRRFGVHWNNLSGGGTSWDFHLAYGRKFPFVVAGFKKICEMNLLNTDE